MNWEMIGLLFLAILMVFAIGTMLWAAVMQYRYDKMLRRGVIMDVSSEYPKEMNCNGKTKHGE